MRLFNRRKEFHLGDPRLVGIAPLKPVDSDRDDDGGGGEDASKEAQVKKAGTKVLMYLPTLPNNSQEKCSVKMRRTPPAAISGGPGQATWSKRVSLTWDTIRRSESSENLHIPKRQPPASSNFLHCTTLNRRETYFFDEDKTKGQPKLSDRLKDKLSGPLRHANSTGKLNMNKATTSGSAPVGKKLGRVESLRMLLSKSQSKLAKGKIDKGTDTGDLSKDQVQPEDDDLLFTSLSPRRNLLNGGSLASSSTSQLPTSPYDFDYEEEDDEILGGNTLPSSVIGSSGAVTLRRCSLPSTGGVGDAFMMKTTSCENLTAVPRVPGQLNGRYLANTLDGCGILQKATSMASMTTNTGKRSSFPYAYIRSKLTALPEEPGGRSSPTKETDKHVVLTSQSVRQPQKPPRRSLSQRNFFHSMGDLLHSRSSSVVSTTQTEASDEEDDEGDDDDFVREHGLATLKRCNSRRAYDPLTQVRLDLLHKNTPQDSIIDFGDGSPLEWGKRSHSIGDILTAENRRKASGGGEEMSSGYDSDSTRNGHESPKMGGKGSDGGSTPSPVEDKSYRSPMAYVTLSREKSQKSALPKPIRSQIPRSQSISCINVNGDGSKGTATLGRKRRRGGSAEVKTPKSMPTTSDEDDEDKNSNATAFGSKTCVLLTGSDAAGRASSASSSKSSAAPSLRLRNKVRERERPRSQSLCLSIFSVRFEKGPTKKSLGFSVVGGKDSPRGSMGIFIKRIFPYGQASEEGSLTEGDEVLSVNGQSLSSVTHQEALNIFKDIKGGEVLLQVARREKVTTGAAL